MRVVVRVRPGAKRTKVGGSYDGGLVVCVVERAVDGKATAAVLSALAATFSVSSREVRLLSGAKGRTKIVEISGGSRETLNALLAR